MSVPQRYDRNVSALSEDDCALLGTKHVTVIGCGGLGGIVIEELARIGVGRLRIVDGDVFEESNLNRQIMCTESSIGLQKAPCAAQRVRAVNSTVSVEPVVAYLTEGNAAELVAGSDCVVDCLDNFEARFWLAHACQQAGLPLVYGAIAGWFGQVSCVFPGDTSFATLYGSPEGESHHKRLGNLPFTAHSVAAFQTAEAVKVLTGRGEPLRNRLLMIDLLDGSAEEMQLR